MKRNPLFVALSNPKGGMEKSTFTVLLASYFHCLNGYNVLVVNCDYPQHSISAMRDKEVGNIEKTCISGVCCADSSTGRARRCILFLPAFRERNWKRHFP